MYFTLEKRNDALQIQQDRGLAAYPHLHGHVEIVYVESGGTSVGYADNKSADFGPGDLFIAFPNQIHYYLDKVRPISVKLIIFSPDICPEFNKIFKTCLPKSPVLKNVAQNPLICSAIQTLDSCNQKKEPYAETLARGSLLMLLSELFRQMELEENISTSSDHTKEIINFCYDNYDTDISLQSIADALHISRYYISHLFSRRLQVGFNEYINSLRIRKACELLTSHEKSITEIAYAVGYNSTRTFGRCFKAVRGMTPKEYRTRAFEKKKAKEEQGE